MTRATKEAILFGFICGCFVGFLAGLYTGIIIFN